MNPLVGWAAIVSSTQRPQGTAQLIKVPHHGSPDADFPPVWSSMLVDDPIALVTPFAGGTNPRPAASDVSRLKERTDELYATGPARGRTPERRDHTVEKTMNQVARSRRVRIGRMGHAQVRWKVTAMPGTPPSIQLFNGAERL